MCKVGENYFAKVGSTHSGRNPRLRLQVLVHRLPRNEVTLSINPASDAVNLLPPPPSVLADILTAFHIGLCAHIRDLVFFDETAWARTAAEVLDCCEKNPSNR